MKSIRSISRHKKVLLTVVICVAVILAGCGGINGSADVSNGKIAGGAAADGNNRSDGASNSSNAHNNSFSASSENLEKDWLNISKPGKYVFEIETAEKGTGRMSFETTKITDKKVKVKINFKLGGVTSEKTVTAPVGEVAPELVLSPAYTYLAMAQIGGFGTSFLVGGGNLEVGNEFIRQTEDGTVSIKVTGKDSYAGIDCHILKININGTLTEQFCTPKPGSSVPYIAYYNENGTLDQRVELVKYERE